MVWSLSCHHSAGTDDKATNFHLCRFWFNRVIEWRYYLRSLQCMADLTPCVVVRMVTLKTAAGIKKSVYFNFISFFPELHSPGGR